MEIVEVHVLLHVDLAVLVARVVHVLLRVHHLVALVDQCHPHAEEHIRHLTAVFLIVGIVEFLFHYLIFATTAPALH